jgi:hypothetical protein
VRVLSPPEESNENNMRKKARSPGSTSPKFHHPPPANKKSSIPSNTLHTQVPSSCRLQRDCDPALTSVGLRSAGLGRSRLSSDLAAYGAGLCSELVLGLGGVVLQLWVAEVLALGVPFRVEFEFEVESALGPRAGGRGEWRSD